VIVRRLGADGEPLNDVLAEGVVGANGLLAHPALMSEAITPGGLRGQLSGGGFLPGAGVLRCPHRRFWRSCLTASTLPKPASITTCRFKFTAWGFSLFRGGA
jgi:5-hydroxyisourate hydrolase